MADPGELTPGTTFGGYRIDRLLGRGGMGAVYAAEQIEDGRIVAVKVLNAGLSGEDDRQRFLREGRTAAAINHPNTVYVYRTEEIDGIPTITMELVDGGTLEEKVERLGPLSVADAIGDTLQIIDGLDAAQRVGILHRDIKPANCFVGPSGEVKVGDFGLSRPVDQVDRVRLTQTGLFLGTPVFSSPEQLMGETLDLRSDIYAVGATLYFLLSGKLPYDADNAVRLIAVVMSGTPTPLTQHRPDVPAALNAAVMKCLMRKREERFADYASLREALVACLPAAQVPAPIVRRVAAGLVDGWAITSIATPIFAAVATRMGLSFAELSQHPTAQSVFLQASIALPFELAWYGLLEGRLGWTPGKLLTGLRVVRETGGPPGILRGAGRALFVLSPGFLGGLGMLVAKGPVAQLITTGGLGIALMLAFFARARRSNGFLAEHDRFTGTRVVQARKAVVHARAEAGPADVLKVAGANAERVGPYDIVERLPSGDDVLVAVDSELRRPVWVVRRPAGAAELPATERKAVRRGCLRWIGGRRSDTEAWDAYAAVRGRTLRDRLRAPADWSEVHRWLNDLVTELGTREDPQVELSRYSLDHVWISDDGQAVLLPFPVGEGHTGAPSTSNLLRELAGLVRATSDQLLARDTWPLRAHAALAVMEIGNLEHARVSLAHAAERTEVMTSRKRASLWGTITLPVLLMAGFSYLVSSNALPQNDKDELRMEPLIGFLSNKPAKVDTLAPQRQAVAIYIAGHFREKIQGHPKDAKSAVLSVKEWKRADSVITAVPTVTPSQLLDADRLVDSTWHGRPPGELDRAVMFPAIMLVTLVVFIGLFSLGAAAFVRRGFPMRVLNLEIATRDGHRAGRVRLVWRQVLVLIPPALLCAAVVTAAAKHGFTLLPVSLGAAALLLNAVALITAWRAPARGLTERWSGTRMVPE